MWFGDTSKVSVCCKQELIQLSKHSWCWGHQFVYWKSCLFNYGTRSMFTRERDVDQMWFPKNEIQGSMTLPELAWFKNASHVFVCWLDATGAFERVTCVLKAVQSCARKESTRCNDTPPVWFISQAVCIYVMEQCFFLAGRCTVPDAFLHLLWWIIETYVLSTQGWVSQVKKMIERLGLAAT